MQLRHFAPLVIVSLVAVSGCRTPMNYAATSSEPYTGQVLPVTQSEEPPAAVPAIEQVAAEPEDLSARAERLWNRIRPSHRISLPRTDFWQDETESEQLEPVGDFGTGF